MARIYSEKKLQFEIELNEAFEKIQLDMEQKDTSCEPSENSINFILNYSKSLSVKESKNIGNVYLNLN